MNELQLAYRTGLTVDRYIQRRSDGQRWNGSAFEAFNAAHWTTYAAALTEQGASGTYVGDAPAALLGGTRALYRVEYRLRAGGSAAISDAGLADEVRDWGPSGDNLPAAAVAPILYGAAGAVEWTITIKDPSSVLLPGAAVYVSSDLAGANRSEVRLTDSLGRVVFQLDPGPVYAWVSHPAYTATNPYLETVS